MKKIISVIISCVMIFGALFTTPLDASYFVISASATDYVQYTLNADGVSYTVEECYVTQSGEVVIPDEYEGYPVTSINAEAFKGCTKITAVTIGNNVTDIGARAFSGCTRVTSIIIGNNVTNIGQGAFQGCTRLYYVTLGTDVCSIGSDAFDGASVKKVYISDFEAWCKISFANKNSNPANGAYLCLNGTNVTEINIPQGITAVDDYAFYGCDGITSVTVSDSVTSIGESAFSLTEATSVTMGDGVKTIDSYAFNSMIYLEKVSFGKGITTIKNYAFNASRNIAEVHIKDISSWLNITFSTLYNNPLCFGGVLYCDGVKVENLIIPDGTTEIKDYAFKGCSGIKSLTIPSSVTIIGTEAFNSCSNLVHITANGDFDIIEKGAFTDSGYYADASNWENYGLYLGKNLLEVDKTFSGAFAIKEGTEYVAECAAYQNTGIIYLSVADSVKIIGKKAFSYATGLVEVIFGENLEKIDISAFQGCNRLDVLKFNSNLKEVGSSAFYNCSGISEVYIDDLTLWCRIEFSDYSSNPVFYARSLYVNNEKITDLVIPEGITKIEKNAFYNLRNLTSITVPSSIKEVESYAFYGCQGPDIINISDLSAWCNIVFEDSAANPLFGKGCLYLGGKLLETISVPRGVTKINDFAFCNIRGATSVILPDSVTEIGKHAFANSTSLTSITIPETVVKIDNTAFSSSSAITVYCYENSYAHEFCQTNSVPFVLIELAPLEGVVVDSENNLIFVQDSGRKNISDIVTTSSERHLILMDSEDNTNYLNTSDVVSVYENDEKVADYTVIINGDVNGDSVCDVLDVATVEQAVNALESVSVYGAYAANNSANATVDITTYQTVVNTALES